MKSLLTILIIISFYSCASSQTLPGFSSAQSKVIRALVSKSVDSVRSEYKAADVVLKAYIDAQIKATKLYADTNSTRKINNLSTLQFNQLQFKQDSAKGGYFISLQPLVLKP